MPPVALQPTWRSLLGHQSCGIRSPNNGKQEYSAESSYNEVQSMEQVSTSITSLPSF
jgi:hypothetical protein